MSWPTWTGEWNRKRRPMLTEEEKDEDPDARSGKATIAGQAACLEALKIVQKHHGWVLGRGGSRNWRLCSA